MPEWATGTPPQLPDHLRLTVSARWIELACQRCGWFRLFRRERTSTQGILTAAHGHFCPTKRKRA
jgi:hypothetical protein